MLLHVVDIAPIESDADAADEFRAIERELVRFSQDLSEKPRCPINGVHFRSTAAKRVFTLDAGSSQAVSGVSIAAGRVRFSRRGTCPQSVSLASELTFCFGFDGVTNSGGDHKAPIRICP